MAGGDNNLSVILPNYNGAALLAANLPSLFEALHRACLDGYEVIVVDDCSSDDSVSRLAADFPQVVVVRNLRNLGFSATCNTGIRAATSPLLCIANTDVTFTPDYFVEALRHFADPAVFAVKGDIINYATSTEQPLNVERTSQLYFKRGLFRFNQRVGPTADALRAEVNGQFVLLGCCFVCRREQALALGGYDEIYSPFYWEDADLALRALERGLRLIYEPRCKVFHQLSSTISKTQTNNRRRLVSIRNKFLFAWRHLPHIRRIAADDGSRPAPNLLLRHLLFLGLSLATRWLVLDWKYYVSLSMALRRLSQFRRENSQ